jgi:hypothetical protein
VLLVRLVLKNSSKTRITSIVGMLDVGILVIGERRAVVGLLEL